MIKKFIIPRFDLLIGLWASFGALYNLPLIVAVGFYFIIKKISKSCSYQKTFTTIFNFAFGYFLIQLYWVCFSVQTVGMWYLMPLAFLGIPAIMAIVMGGIMTIYHPLRYKKIPAVFIFSTLWTMGELIIGKYCFGGFPWCINGYLWGIEILQSTSVIGIYSLSLLSNLLFVAPFSKSLKIVIPITSIFIGFFVFGKYQISLPSNYLNYQIRIVQPSIPLDVKWNANNLYHIMDLQNQLSIQQSTQKIDMVIWPESAVPFLVIENQDQNLQNKIQNLFKFLTKGMDDKTILVAGGIRNNADNQIFNCIFMLNNQGKIIDTYDKKHLVPFGEYIPMKWLNPIPKITYGENDYTPGNGKNIFQINNNVSFSPLICYEAIFSGEVIPKNLLTRPKFVINVTNDVWFGTNHGPKQHLKIITVRAIEEGIAILRCANNGISAVIDPHGRALQKLSMNQVGVIDSMVPSPKNEINLFVKYGNWILILLMAIFLTIGLLANRPKSQ